MPIRSLLLLFAAAAAYAQPGGTTPPGTTRSGPSLPATCSPGPLAVYFKTTATAGLYQCLTANTWTAVPTGSGPTGAAGGKLSGTYPNPGLNAASTDLTDTANLPRLDANNVFTGTQTIGATLLGTPIAAPAPDATKTQWYVKTGGAWCQQTPGAVETCIGATVYPGAGIANSTGSAWGTSYTTSGSGTVVALATGPVFSAPNLGTPTALVLTNATGLPNASVIGLGTSATVNTGTSGATVPLLNGANTWSGAQTLQSNQTLSNTTFASQVGIIYKASNPFLSNFNYGNNGTVTTQGNNIFLGNSGNFTMGSTATLVPQASMHIGIGDGALASITTAKENTAIGYLALNLNATGDYNIAVGVHAGESCLGASNVIVGVDAMSTINCSGGGNVAVGTDALQANTSGLGNTAIGDHAMAANTSGYYNSAVGDDALQKNTTGIDNAAVGLFSGNENTTGHDNLYLGYQSGYNAASATNGNKTGSNNTFVGANTGASSSTQQTYMTIVGADATAACSSCVVLGRSTDTVSVPGTFAVSTGTPVGSANKATCWKTTTTLGYCSTIVGADGSCTCN